MPTMQQTSTTCQNLAENQHTHSTLSQVFTTQRIAQAEGSFTASKHGSICEAGSPSHSEEGDCG